MSSFENFSDLRAAGYGPAVKIGAGLHSYGEAVWWTAMIMATIGSSYWPLTLAGRILCFLLALFAFGIFGYISAHFIGKEPDAESRQGNAISASNHAVKG